MTTYDPKAKRLLRESEERALMRHDALTKGSREWAREHAKHDRHYCAREGRNGTWFVWDSVSDHRVEFDD